MELEKSQGNSFGCCHRYRQCSDAKRCLLQDIDSERAKQCTYRSKLEQGNIFYGKNANAFSMEQYEKILSVYKNLDSDVLLELNNLISYFVGNLYLSTHAVWYFSEKLEPLQKLGLIEIFHNIKEILNKYEQAQLKAASGLKITKKDELIEHIIHNQPQVLAQLVDTYCHIRFPSENRMYILELYYDFLANTTNSIYRGAVPFSQSIKQRSSK